MIIGINGRFLIARKTGVQRVALNLINSVTKMDSNNQYIIFTGKDYPKDLIREADNVKVVVSAISPGSIFRNHYWEQITLPKLAQKYNVDILHNPANIGPLFYRGISIVNIHDLCFLVNPGWYSLSFRTLYKTVIPQIAGSTKRVITNSNNSKNDIFQYLHCPPNKVSLIYWAVDDLFLKYKNFLDPNFPYSDYILYVGSVEPRKNIGRLLTAYELLRKTHRHLKTKLVIIGCPNPVFKGERFFIKEYTNDISFLGYVSDKALINYYAHASVCIYPSLYEGFGLPPLEAMACETPVITSNKASLPEVVGDAALTINPTDVREIYQSLYRILTDEKLHNDLIAKGRQRIKKFSWEKAAKSTIRVYQELYKEYIYSSEKKLVGARVLTPNM